MTDNPEFLLRVHCILSHCQKAERDGLANSLGHLRSIEEDARALEDLLIDGRTDKAVHLE
jgi:hypothetical protein